MSNSFSFLGPEEFDQHHCEAVREGEWLVFKCPDCAYERRFNNKTGEMEVRQGAPDATHRGQYQPVGLNFRNITFN